MKPNVYVRTDIPSIGPASALQITPGPLRTSLDRSAVGVGSAFKKRNCSTERGVWRRDQRFRYVQVAPQATFLGESCLPAQEMASFSNVDRSSGAAWSSPANAAVADSTYATVMVGIGESSDYLAAVVGAEGLPDGCTVTSIKVRVRFRTTGDYSIDAAADSAALLEDGVPVGDRGTSELIPREFVTREFVWSGLAMPLTNLSSGAVEFRLGVKAIPETDVYGSGWTIAITPASSQTSTGNPASVTEPYTLEPTRSSLQPSSVILEVTTFARGRGVEGTPMTALSYEGSATASDGFGGVDSGAIEAPTVEDEYPERQATATEKVRVELPGSIAVSPAASASLSIYPTGNVAEAFTSISAMVVAPDPVTVEVDHIQAVVCYQVEVESTPTPQGLGIGVYAGESDIAAVIGGGVFDAPGSVTSAAMGDDWRPERSGSERTSGSWSLWQFAEWLYYAHETGGLYRRTIGANDWEPIFLDSESPGSTGDASVAAPTDYANEAIVESPDAVALVGYGPAFNSGSSAGISTSTPSVPYVKVSNVDKRHERDYVEFEIEYSEPRDWTRAQCLAMKMVQATTDSLSTPYVSGFDSRASFWRMEIENTTGDIATFYPAIIKGDNLNTSSGGACWSWWEIADPDGLDVLSDVKKVRIKFGCVEKKITYYGLVGLYIGGRRYRDDQTWPFSEAAKAGDHADGPVEYAYRVIQGTTIGQARLLTVTDDTHLGGRLDSRLPYMGTQMTVTVPMADAPFTDAGTIEIYRKDPGGAWRQVATGPNSEELIFDDDLSSASLGSNPTPSPALNFDETDAGYSGIVTGVLGGCSWKGSNVFWMRSGTVNFSRTNSGNEVLWEGVVLTNDVGSSDLGPPRTSVVADDTVSPVIVAVAAENLYCFTRSQCYVFVSGDTAATSSFPRKVDGVRGAVGARAACAFGDRALVASDDGLWMLKKGSDWGEQPDELVEVTALIRESWAWLLGDSASTVVVRQALGEAWVFNQDRYLHFTRDGDVVEGQWANEDTVFDAAYYPTLGMVLLMGSGRLAVLGDFTTDGGENLAGDNGTEFRWLYETGETGEGQALRVHLDCYVQTGSDVEVVAVVDGQEVTRSISKPGRTVSNVAVDRKDSRGSYAHFVISGGPNDQVNRVAIEYKDRPIGRGA